MFDVLMQRRFVVVDGVLCGHFYCETPFVLSHTQLEGALDSLVGRHDDHAFSVFNDCKYSMEMECEARPGEARRGEA